MRPPAPDRARANWICRLPPGARLLGAFLLVLGITLLPRRLDALFLAPAALVFLLWAMARMPFRYALPRLLVAEMFIIGLALLSLFSPAAAPVFLSAFVKSNLCILTMLVLTWTTPFHQVLAVLRRTGIPSLMLTTLALMYRYLPVLREEGLRMRRARASRTFSKRRAPAWAAAAGIVSQLFLRTLARAERIYLAMCARGWK